MTKTKQNNLIIVGNADAPEMYSVREAVHELAISNNVRNAHNIPEALSICTTESWFPNLLILCQNWSHEFTQNEINQLLTTLPLCRLVCCYGIWCEADGRNYDLIPFASRVQARMAGSRIRYEWDVLNGNAPPLPMTASRDEIFGQQSSEKFPAPPAGTTTKIISPDNTLKETWQELLSTAGWHLLQENKGESPALPDLLLWDIDPWSATLANKIAVYHTEHSAIPIIGMMNACRPEDYHEATAHGIVDVLPKLAPVEMLLQRLLTILIDTSINPNFKA